MKAQLNIINSMIFSKVKNHVLADVGTKYKMTASSFSTVGAETSSAKFPFVYIALVSGVESNTDLEAINFNGGSYTYQINVYDNVSQARVKEVMDSVATAMKNMAFTIASLPIFATNESTYVQIARFQRFIDEGDEV